MIKSWNGVNSGRNLNRLLILRFIPESVRWQLTKGKTEEAKKTLRAVAKENGQKVCEDVLEQLCQQTEAERKQAGGKTPSVLELFKYRNLAQKSVIIFFLW